MTTPWYGAALTPAQLADCVECSICGCVVSDRRVHDEFHRDDNDENDERLAELERTTSNLDESVSNLTSDVERIDGRVDRLYDNPDD